jgi:HD-GYP domain-containing protein (c-di-GMP phosphodiesterase class II)
LKRFGDRVTKFGVNFAVCSADGGLVLLCDGGKFESNRKLVIDNCLLVIEKDVESHRLSVIEGQFLVTVLKSASVGSRQGEAVGAALIDLGEKMADGNSVEGIAKQTYTRSEIFSEMLLLLAESFQAGAKAEEQIEVVGTELAQVYEELVLLHKLSANMKVTKPNANFLQMACDSLTDIVSVKGIAILLEKTIDDEKQLVLAAGSGLIDIDEWMTDVLPDRLVEEINSGKEALLDSEVDSPFRYDWSDSIKSIIAVPLFGRDRREAGFARKAQNGNSVMGLMVAINRIDKPDFDSTDVKLFNSVASGCAVFIENGRLFKDLKELFIGSLKALTSSIDAKDQYTRGHSERVAFISRWIAEKLAEQEPLEEEQIHRIYLAGLLHDIGKVGVDETVLRKEGRLAEQELNRIRAHPLIGAGILSEIKQMRDIVPGVLCHHERIDGKGYPNALVGEQIPLIGRIVGLADSFDAMTSMRTYRGAMTVKEALAEVEKGLGTQFDEKVGRIFINSDVYQLWDIMQNGFAEIYGAGNFSEYDAVAVGTLIG